MSQVAAPTTLDIFRQWYEDSFTDFKLVREWKDVNAWHALGYFPVYFPVELAEAFDTLPVALYGAEGRINLDIAIAHTQSFVCTICKSVFQLGAEKRLDAFDILVFSNICDVARNLSGIVKRNLPDKTIVYLHYPIHNDTELAVSYLVDEYRRLVNILEETTGIKYDEERLREAIRLHNEKRRLIKILIDLRREKPWLVPFTEYYIVTKAASIMPVEKYNKLLERYIGEVVKRDVRPADRLRILVKGNFCEQPPLMFMKTIEDAGAYIIEDESLIGQYWIGKVSIEGDPLLELAKAYVSNDVPLTVRYHPSLDKQEFIKREIKEKNAEGVLFLSPKFCEPSLYDYIIYKKALDEIHFPYLHLEYEETTSSFEHLRTMVETFVESIMFD